MAAVAAEAAACAVVAEEECEQAVERALVAFPVEAGRLVADTAVLGARRRCRDQLVARRQSIGPQRVVQALGRVTETCQRPAAVELEAVRALAALLVGQAEPGQVLVLDLALVHGRALQRAPVLVRWPTVAAAQHNGMCKTS